MNFRKKDFHLLHQKKDANLVKNDVYLVIMNWSNHHENDYIGNPETLGTRDIGENV